jgi:hypothetical protein
MSTSEEIDRLDWTAKDGRTNSSEAYLAIVAAVQRLILQSGDALIRGRIESIARLIVSQLAHVYGMKPDGRPR